MRTPATARASRCRSPTRSSARHGRRAACERCVRDRRLLPAARRRCAGRRSSSSSRGRSRMKASSCSRWRDVPVDEQHVGETAKAYAPVIRQVVVGAAPGLDQDAFERKLYVIRRVAELAAGADLVVPSFSSRTLVYKGMLVGAAARRASIPTSPTRCSQSALALVHSRYSTNTFPSWELAHPYRLIAHNGEINTLRGNVNWMRARESQLRSELFGDDLAEGPAGDPPRRLRHRRVRQRARAARARRPFAAARADDDDPRGVRGPRRRARTTCAASTRTTAVSWRRGTVPRRSRSPTASVIGATLDRNGLRPGRWYETADGWVVLASETGVLDERPENVVRKGRLQPGKLFLVDLAQGRIVPDEELKREIATQRPYAKWVDEETVHLRDLPVAEAPPPPDRDAAHAAAALRLRAGGHEGDPRAARAQRRGGGRLDGQRHAARRALAAQAAPLLVLQAAVRAGDESADRLDPRGDGDERHRERRLRAQPARRDAGARATARDREPDPARQRARAAPARALRRLHELDGRHDVGRRRRRRRPRARHRADLRGSGRSAQRGLEHPHPLRPQGRARARADPVAARDVRSAQPPRPRRHATPGRHRRRVRRAAQRAQHRDARRLRRRRGEPVSDARDARGARRARLARQRDVARRGTGARDEGHREGPAQDDVEDGHLDRAVVLRRADLRGRRPLARARRAALHRHGDAHRRRGPARHRRGLARAARARVPRRRRPAAAGAGPVRVAPRG